VESNPGRLAEASAYTVLLTQTVMVTNLRAGASLRSGRGSRHSNERA
jgi:hypothetical protein